MLRYFVYPVILWCCLCFTLWADDPSSQIEFFENHSKFYVLPQYFMFRWHLLYTIFDHAVITHGHEMDKQEILKKLIESLNKRLEE